MQAIVHARRHPEPRRRRGADDGDCVGRLSVPDRLWMLLRIVLLHIIQNAISANGGGWIPT